MVMLMARQINETGGICSDTGRDMGIHAGTGSEIGRNMVVLDT